MSTIKFEMNIGLNNNPMTGPQIYQLLRQNKYLSEVETREDVGEYGGIKEPTLVVKGRVSSVTVLHNVAELLSNELNQECIAYRVDTHGNLAFNSRYEDKPIAFSDDYFINF